MSQLTTENEITKKELNKANMLIYDFQNEVDTLQKENQDLSNTNIILKQKYETEKSTNDSLSTQLTNEINTQKTLTDNLNTLQEQNEKIKNELFESQSLNSKYKTQLFENGKKINELNNSLTSFQQLQKQFNDNKLLYSQLERNHQRLTKEKQDLETTLQKAKTQIKQLQSKQTELNKHLNTTKQKLLQEKKEIIKQKEIIQQNLTQKETNVNDMTTLLHNKEQEIRKCQEMIIEHEKQNLALSTQNEETQKLLEQIQSQSATDIEILKSNINDLNLQLDHMKKLYDTTQTNLDNVNKENVEFKNKISALLNEKDQLENELAMTKSLLDNSKKNYELKTKENQTLQENLIVLKTDNDNLMHELPFWKDKYDKDTNNQLNELIQLKNTIKDLHTQIDEINNKNSKITNDNVSLNDAFSNLKCNFDNINNTYVQTANDNEALKNELNSKIKQISELEDIVHSLKNENVSNIDHIKDLSSKMSDIISEKAKYVSITQTQNQKIDEIIQYNSNKEKMCDSLTLKLENQYRLIQNCIDIIIEQTQLIKNTQKNNFCSKHFIEYLQSLDILSSNTVLTPIDKLKAIKSFIQEIFDEYNNLANETTQLNEENKLLNNKNKSLLNNINDYADNMNKANLYIENNESKLKQACEDNLSYKQSNEDLMHKISAQRNEIEKISFELSDIIEQNQKLKAMNQKLNIDNVDMEQIIKDNEYQVNALEKRIAILNKETKMYDKILNQICSVSNMKNLSSIINYLMNTIDDIAVLEREKMKTIKEGKPVNSIDNKLNEKNKEYNSLYDMYQQELNKSSQKTNDTTFRNTINRGKYMYSSPMQNTYGSGSYRSFSPNNRYATTSNNYCGTETDYDKINTLQSGDFSLYNSHASRFSMK